MFFRLRFLEQGSHTLIRVFAGRSIGGLGKCGDLVLRNEEWKEFQKCLTTTNGATVEVLEERVNQDYCCKLACQKLAAFHVYWGYIPGNNTSACEEHLGELIGHNPKDPPPPSYRVVPI